MADGAADKTFDTHGKAEVHLVESWESPETTIRHTLVFQIMLKLANLVVLFLAQNIGTVDALLPDPPAGEEDERCPEGEAAKTFVLLIITDALISAVIVYFVKAFLYHPARFCKEKVLKKTAKKTVPFPPSIVPN